MRFENFNKTIKKMTDEYTASTSIYSTDSTAVVNVFLLFNFRLIYFKDKTAFIFLFCRFVPFLFFLSLLKDRIRMPCEGIMYSI
jgi:hypothetical protein